MHIGNICSSMSRRGGGVSEVVRCLSLALSSMQLQVSVFAGRDGDSARDTFGWGDVPLHLGEVYGPISFGWQPGLTASLEAVRPDVLHLHGLWTYSSVAALRWRSGAKGTVISPHGMLDLWALRNSHQKKRIAMALFERRNLSGASCIHALCDNERAAIREIGIDTPVAVIPNGVDLRQTDGDISEPNWSSRIPEGAKVLLFLGRIHPKKGLDPLLEAIAELTGADCERWHLVVAGWDQDGAEAGLAEKAEALGLEGRVHFVGPQFGVDKKASFSRADAFVLPSFSEGLPMAILEAWAFSLPVLMTDECNLPEGFSAGAALKVSTDPPEMAVVLEHFFSMDERDVAAMGAAGRRLVETKFSWPAIAKDMAALYAWVAGDGKDMPDTVDVPCNPRAREL